MTLNALSIDSSFSDFNALFARNRIVLPPIRKLMHGLESNKSETLIQID